MDKTLIRLVDATFTRDLNGAIDVSRFIQVDNIEYTVNIPSGDGVFPIG